MRIFICPKDVLWYPVSRTILIGMTWNFFCEHFRPPEIEIHKKKCLSFCDSVILWSVTYLIRYQYLNIIQLSPNLAQLFIWVVSRDVFCFFSEIQIFTPREGLYSLAFFWHTKISKIFVQFTWNLAEECICRVGVCQNIYIFQIYILTPLGGLKCLFGTQICKNLYNLP